MTTDATAQRALLDGKARDELVQIATAAGIKVPARARKAGIIDLILGPVQPDEAQVAAPAAEAEQPSLLDAATPEVAPEATSAGPRVRRVRINAPEVEVASDTPAQAAAQASPAPDASPEVPRRPSNDQLSSRKGEPQGGSDGNRAQGKPTGGNTESRSDSKPSESKHVEEKQSESQQPDGNKSDGKQSDDQNESGNRRRRRRGRGGEEEQWQGDPVDCAGVLDLRDEGYGFLRTRGLLPSADDVYVAAKQVRQFGLRRGDHLAGSSRPASRNEKNPAMLRVDSVNGLDPELSKDRPNFEDLTPLYPDEPLKMEVSWNKANLTARVIDILAPIGKGQRGLIVSPPKAGKTTVIKSIAKSIEENNPEVELMVLLVDERPEEVTDIRRSIKGEVVASTFDRPADEHIQIAELTIERAKRAVESGKDVVVILDGITRLARAYNLAAPGTGRVMSGGVDSAALYPPKKFFGAARNIEEGGSLTILATALIDTGSRMDEVIFEEFKGTGNMELRLDRRLAERRVFPAIDIAGSSTRHEELLMAPRKLDQVWKLRKVLTGIADGDGTAAGISNGAGLELLLDRLSSFDNNEQFLDEVSKNS
jgi:transcription termination factor Rho